MEVGSGCVGVYLVIRLNRIFLSFEILLDERITSKKEGHCVNGERKGATHDLVLV